MTCVGDGWVAARQVTHVQLSVKKFVFITAADWQTMGNQLVGIAPSQIFPVEHYLTDQTDLQFDAK
jgi:hypothetical protein